ncbi:radical SAM protein [Candidatus Gracilibacteria bacterium]|nr:radical SAM protein [Candidatus Gracilibacteria bacterium]
MWNSNNNIYYAYKIISKHSGLIFSTAFYKNTNFDDNNYISLIKKVIKKENNYYIHIPFCITLCNYCYCYKIQNIDNNYHKKYLSYLDKELKIYYKLNGNKKLSYTSLNMGGGTPNLLSDDNFTLLFDILDKYFDLSNKSSMFNIDLNISLLSNKKLLIISKFCNRVSIGIQTYNSKLLIESNRYYDKEKFYNAYFEFFKKNGVAINVDLMIGLTNQTVEDVDSIIKKMIYLKIDNISLNYFHKKDGLSYDFGDKEKELINVTQLKWDSIISKYNKSPNSQVDMETRRDNIIGIGVGAMGNIYGEIGVYRTSFENYYSYIDQGKIYFDSYIIMDKYLEIVSYFFERIVCSIIKSRCISLYGEKNYIKIKEKLNKLFEEGILVENNERIYSTISDKEIMQLLVEYLLKDYIESGFFGNLKDDYDIESINKEFNLFFDKQGKFCTSR